MLSTNAQGQTFKTLSPKPLSRPKAIAVHIFCRLGNQSRRGFRVDVGLSHELQRRQSGLKSIGSWIRVKKIQFFHAGKFSKNFDFFRQISEKFRFFNQLETKFRISRHKLAIYSYILANYSIYLQKSSLSNILPVHDKIIIFHDPSTTPTWI